MKKKSKETNIFRELTEEEKNSGLMYCFRFKGEQTRFFHKVVLEDGEITKANTTISFYPPDSQWYKMNNKVVDYIGIGKPFKDTFDADKMQNNSITPIATGIKGIKARIVATLMNCINCGKIIYSEEFEDLCSECGSVNPYHSISASNAIKLLPASTLETEPFDDEE